MAKQIKFTDNSVFIGYDFEYVDSSGGYSGVFPNAAIVIRAGAYTTPNFIKTDLDGHVWTWNGSILSISGTPIKISVSDDSAVIMNPIAGDNSQRGINVFNGFNTYYAPTHRWRGVQGVANGMTIGSFISKYYQYYDCYNLAINGTIQIELKSDASHSEPRYTAVWDGYGGAPSDLETLFHNSYQDYVPLPEDTDPYNPGGSSGTGGGNGNFDGTSENIEIPELPTMSTVDTGFITLFNPSAGELKNLASYLWGDIFDVSTWKKIFADPMDAILGLSIVPVNVQSAGTATVTIGNISTGVSMTKASSQYVSVDCGTINVNEYWGAYLDYSPYTKAEIYLPFVGTHPVTIDDIMGKPVHVVYHVDVLSGACCAYVQCGGTVLYSFVGQCSCSIPITANDWTNVINGALSIAGSIGTMVATGGATAPMAVTNIASTAVNSLKPDVERSGSMGGMGGMLGVQKPYIILTRPRQAVPARQNTFTGYPSFVTKTLSECSGYTEVENIHLENVPATQNELDEITELLKSGVII